MINSANIQALMLIVMTPRAKDKHYGHSGAVEGGHAGCRVVVGEAGISLEHVPLFSELVSSFYVLPQ